MQLLSQGHGVHHTLGNWHSSRWRHRPATECRHRGISRSTAINTVTTKAIHPSWQQHSQHHELREPPTTENSEHRPTTPQKPSIRLAEWQQRVLRSCAAGSATGLELLAVAGYSSRTGNFKRGLLKLRRLGLLALSVPEHPRSKLQRYQLTQRGKHYLVEIDRFNRSGDRI